MPVKIEKVDIMTSSINYQSMRIYDFTMLPGPSLFSSHIQAWVPKAQPCISLENPAKLAMETWKKLYVSNVFQIFVISRFDLVPRRRVGILRWIARRWRNRLRREVAPRAARPVPSGAEPFSVSVFRVGDRGVGPVALARMVVALNHPKPWGSGYFCALDTKWILKQSSDSKKREARGRESWRKGQKGIETQLYRL